MLAEEGLVVVSVPSHSSFRQVIRPVHLRLFALGARLNANSLLFLFFETDTLIILTPVSLGLKEVVYLSDKYHNTPGMIASRRLLDMAGIQYRYRN